MSVLGLDEEVLGTTHKERSTPTGIKEEQKYQLLLFFPLVLSGCQVSLFSAYANKFFYYHTTEINLITFVFVGT